MDKVSEFRAFLNDSSESFSAQAQDSNANANAALISLLDAQGSRLVPLKTVRQCLEQSRQLSVQSTHLLGYAALNIYGHAIQHLLNQTIPSTRDLHYWDDVISSDSWLWMYGAQHAPVWAWSAGLKLNPAILRKTHNLIALPNVSQLGLRGIVHLVNIPTQALRDHAERKRAALREARDRTAERLGILVSEALNTAGHSVNNADRAVDQSIRVLEEVFDSEGDSATDKLLQVIANFDTDLAASKVVRKKFGKPSAWVRYWPLIAGGSLVAFDLLGNWKTVVKWVRESVIDTLVSGWHNWIVEPMFQVYQTVRHDDNAQIALMNKQSLQSDMRSLERMVVDFVRDSGTADGDVDAIRAAVSQGDLSAVLEPYERQLKSPVTSLIKGELVRSLLIQVQKTKVDVEVAMDGIDKLLQSQQLVFGLVAALPAIAAAWYCVSWLQGIIRGEQRHQRGLRALKDEITACLSEVRRLLDDDLTAKNLGLLLCETAVLRQLGTAVFSRKRFKEWKADLAQLEDVTLDVGELRNRADRLWLIYGSSLA